VFCGFGARQLDYRLELIREIVRVLDLVVGLIRHDGQVTRTVIVVQRRRAIIVDRLHQTTPRIELALRLMIVGINDQNPVASVIVAVGRLLGMRRAKARRHRVEPPRLVVDVHRRVAARVGLRFLVHRSG